MKASKREPRDEWAEKAWFTSEFWMLRSRLSRRDFDVDTLERVISTVRCTPTFKAYLKAAGRESQRREQKPYTHAAALFCAPPSRRALIHTLDLRRRLAQRQRETLTYTERE
jgi:hypothetical protein